MITTGYNRLGYYASDDHDGSSTDYFPTRDALRQALARGTAEFTGGLPLRDFIDEPDPNDLGYLDAIDGATPEEVAAFELRNDPPKHQPRRFDGQDRTLQKALIDGRDCCPGQMDLF
jgi:hypothetical protein